MSTDYSQPSIDKYYSVAENCYNDLCMVRKLFSTTTTEAEAKNGYKALQLMALYCPDECETAVGSTIDEFEWRMNAMRLDYVWTEPEGVMS